MKYLINGKLFNRDGETGQFCRLMGVKFRKEPGDAVCTVVASKQVVTKEFMRECRNAGIPASVFSVKQESTYETFPVKYDVTNLNKGLKYSSLELRNGSLTQSLAKPYWTILNGLMEQVACNIVERELKKLTFSTETTVDTIQENEALIQYSFNEAFRLCYHVLVSDVRYYSFASEPVMSATLDKDGLVDYFAESEPAFSRSRTLPMTTVYYNRRTLTFMDLATPKYFELLILEYGNRLGKKFVKSLTTLATGEHWRFE